MSFTMQLKLGTRNRYRNKLLNKKIRLSRQSDFFCLEPMQCLLQQGVDLVISTLALLVQFYKKVGGCLQGLVDCAGVFAVDGELLQPAYEPVEQRERLVVHIVKAYTFTSLCHKYFLRANIICSRALQVAELPIIASRCHCGISATFSVVYGISFAPKKVL